MKSSRINWTSWKPSAQLSVVATFYMIRMYSQGEWDRGHENTFRQEMICFQLPLKQSPWMITSYRVSKACACVWGFTTKLLTIFKSAGTTFSYSACCWWCSFICSKTSETKKKRSWVSEGRERCFLSWLTASVNKSVSFGRRGTNRLTWVNEGKYRLKGGGKGYVFVSNVKNHL